MKRILFGQMAGLLINANVFADVQYFVAPDRFEIEVVSGVPSLRVSKTKDGVVARVTLVPAYDVALSAIAFHHRASPEEVDTTRLSLDVSDVKMNNRLTKSAVSVQRIEKERDRDRVSVRIVFTPDLTAEQARLMLTSTAAYGDVTGIFVCPEGVPEKICDFKKRTLPTFNQFQQASGEAEQRHAVLRYAALNRFKAETLAAQAGRAANGDILDRMVRETLIEDATTPPKCRADLEPYPSWICRLLLDESAAGSFTEALFSLAKKTFPDPLLNEDYTRLIFDANGAPMRKLSDPQTTAGQAPRRVVEKPATGPRTAFFEGQLARWKKGTIDASTYRQHLIRYARWVFPRASDDEVDQVVATLELMRSFEENSHVTRVLITLPLRWFEDGTKDREKTKEAMTTMAKRVAHIPSFELYLHFNRPIGQAKYWQPYIDRHHAKVDDEERARLVEKYRKIPSIAGSPEFNVEHLRHLFLELERLAPTPAPADD